MVIVKICFVTGPKKNLCGKKKNRLTLKERQKRRQNGLIITEFGRVENTTNNVKLNSISENFNSNGDLLKNDKSLTCICLKTDDDDDDNDSCSRNNLSYSNVNLDGNKSSSGYVILNNQSVKSKNVTQSEFNFNNNATSNLNLNNISNDINKQQRPQNQKYKTEICKNFETKGHCKWEDNCCFAHGKHELRKKTIFNYFYKTKVCKHFHKNGYCPYASRCQYFHFKTFQIFQELLESFSNKLVQRISENGHDNKKVETIQDILERNGKVSKRLPIFEKLRQNKTVDKSLYEKFELDNL